ncbi:hypothetical protein LJC34_02525 [Oscillospiraceae bacterium OttesenSCG-928-G22]|nr:hypothetical protein [Oscillospiraceae bacterium OttesenSCG-928-G22]
MRDSSKEDWEYRELAEADENEAITKYHTEAPSGYNKRAGSTQVAVLEGRYKGQPIACSNGMIFDNATAAANWLFGEGRGASLASCKANLLMHLKGKTKICYGYYFNVIDTVDED